METLRRYAPIAARVLLGLAFFVFGLNGFLGFLPMPPLSGDAGAFMGALAAAGYMFPLIKGTEVVAGLLLLSNRFSALALVLLAPILVNIVAFHAVFDPAGMALPVVLVALEIFVAWTYRDAYRGVLAAKVEPHVGAVSPVSAARPAHA